MNTKPQPGLRYFITATDTGAGKTYVTCLLLRALRAAGRAAAGFKPVCCGSRQDVAEILEAGSPGLSAEEVNPVFYKMPLAPLAAGMLENRPFAMETVRAAWAGLSVRFADIIVEGCGGWEVPLTAELSVADLAAELGNSSRQFLEDLLHAQEGRVLKKANEAIQKKKESLRIPTSRLW